MGKFFQYDQKSLEAAVAEMRENPSAVLRRIARKYNVPHVTLKRKLEKGDTSRKMGPATYLTTEEEKLMENWILANANKGTPLNKGAVLETVKCILDDDVNRKTPFKDNMPGKKWFYGYLKRHPRISERYPEGINGARAAVTEAHLRHWHSELGHYLKEEGNDDILRDPTRIFNCDESGFAICPTTGRVLGPRGDKNFFVINGSEKENVTALCTINAAGSILPTMIVLPYERVPREIAENLNPEWVVGRSKKGWMTGQAFYGYVGNFFIPHIKKSGLKLPVLLLVDGHKSHLTFQVATLCKDNGIILYSFYPNATHILQPADVSVFKSLKGKWKKQVAKWKEQTKNKNVSKVLFGSLLEFSIAEVTNDVVKNGFRKCGIYPFDANAIDYTKTMKHETRAGCKPTNFGPEHLLFVESVMPLATVKNFRVNCISSDWEPSEPEKLLYGVWKKLRVHAGYDGGEKNVEETPPAENQTMSEAAVEDMWNDTGRYCENEENACMHANGEENLFPKTPESLKVSSGAQISPSFARHVFWPTESPEKGNKKKRERLPHSATSKRWLDYHMEKEQEKNRREEEKLAKKRKREENKLLKESQAASKSKLRKEKEREREESCTSDNESLDLPSSDDCSWGGGGEEEISEDERDVFLDGVEGVGVGDYILVEFPAGSRIVHYIGEVSENDAASSFKTKFLRRRGRSFTFSFPTVEDSCCVSVEKIKGKLQIDEKNGKTSRTSSLIKFKNNLTFFSETLR